MSVDWIRTHRKGWSRRAFLLGAGATVATATVGRGGAGWARAAGCERVVVGTWGGDYARLLEQHIWQPLRASMDFGMVTDLGSASTRKSKLIADTRRAQGTFDVVCLDQIDMSQMERQHLLRKLSSDDIPNIGNVIEPLRRPYSVPHVYSARVIVFNPDKVAVPRSYRDLWRPEYAGKIGFADLLAVPVLESAALAWGGGPSNYEPGKAKLLELKSMGIRIYPSNEALALALKTGEIWATIMWRARAYQWRRAGISVDSAVPEEGATPIAFEAAIPRNAPSPDCAFKFLNQMLDSRSQAGFAEAMGYLPTVANADIPDALRKELGFTAEERARFVKQNYAYIEQNQWAFREWWDKEFKG